MFDALSVYARPRPVALEDFSEGNLRRWLEGAVLFSAYHEVSVPQGSKLALLTRIASDRDQEEQLVMATLLRRALPDVRLRLISLVNPGERRLCFHPEVFTDLWMEVKAVDEPVLITNDLPVGTGPLDRGVLVDPDGVGPMPEHLFNPMLVYYAKRLLAPQDEEKHFQKFLEQSHSFHGRAEWCHR